jgi:putative endonuclease
MGSVEMLRLSLSDSLRMTLALFFAAELDLCPDIMKRIFHVYILTNVSKMLYVGVTNDLQRRTHEHKHKLVPGFSAKYNLHRLVYFEAFGHIGDAIAREKTNQGLAAIKESRMDSIPESEMAGFSCRLVQSAEYHQRVVKCYESANHKAGVILRLSGPQRKVLGGSF